MSRLHGLRAEQTVASYLTQRSYRIVTQNYRVFSGEIDLVAATSDYLIFVEVKQRTQALFDMTELITRAKQRKIITAAHHFLMQHPEYQSYTCRFDVALVEQHDAVTYIENAFYEHE